MQSRVNVNVTYYDGKIIDLYEKIKSIEISKKSLIDNTKQHELKKKNLLLLLKNLKGENFKAHEVLEVQENNINKILGGLEEKHLEVSTIKTELEEKIQKHNQVTKGTQEKLIMEIKENDIQRHNITDNENDLIKLILGIDLIRR